MANNLTRFEPFPDLARDADGVRSLVLPKKAGNSGKQIPIN